MNLSKLDLCHAIFALFIAILVYVTVFKPKTEGRRGKEAERLGTAFSRAAAEQARKQYEKIADTAANMGATATDLATSRGMIAKSRASTKKVVSAVLRCKDTKCRTSIRRHAGCPAGYKLKKCKGWNSDCRRRGRLAGCVRTRLSGKYGIQGGASK